jgi:spore coat polysaccharide biosynthesis protein SpsF
MRRVIIVQARTTSTRLPGKVLMDLAGRPMLAQQLRRLKHCRGADDIVVATTTNAADDPVIELAHVEGVGWFRGSEHDVLGRFVGATRQARADVVVRITADCPLIDPEVTDRVIHELVTHATDCDYASNVLERTYPRGLDAEAMFSDTLCRMGRLAQSPAAREHVTVAAVSEQPTLFLRWSVTDTRDNSDLRWCVDTELDLRVVRALYEALDLDGRLAGYREIVAYARAHPTLASANAHIKTWDPLYA